MKYTVDPVDRTSVDARITALREKYGFTAYVGDDYGPGGNDESVFHSDFCALKIDDYTMLEERLKEISIL